MKKFNGLSSLVVLAALFAASPALANGIGQDGAAQMRIGITGQVPVICRVSLDAAVLSDADGRAQVGTMKEFCNNPSGYRVVMNYPSAMESGRLIVDGRAVALDGSGSVTVSRSVGAAVAEHRVEIELNQGGYRGDLSFRIELL